MNHKTKLPLVFLYTDNTTSIEGATRFQKLIFLAQEETNLKETYEYRPDRFGPYSPQLRSDLEAFDDAGYIQRDIHTNKYGSPRITYSLTTKGIQEAQQLLQAGNDSVFEIIQKVKKEHNDRPISELLQYVYHKYEEFVNTTDVETKTLFDPDARSEFERLPKATAGEPTTIGERLNATPHTLYQMPKRETNAYFYYFTDDTYGAEDSKFKTLDDELTLLGRNRSHLEVAMIDRDRIRVELWDTLINGFGIDDYPALVVADSELGVRDVDLDTDSFTPGDGDYAVIENGIIADSILDDNDQIRNFLNGLFDCARIGKIKNGMRKKKVIEGLKIGKDEITAILSISN